MEGSKTDSKTPLTLLISYKKMFPLLLYVDYQKENEHGLNAIIYYK